MTGRELDYIAEAHANGALSGDGPFTARCSRWLEAETQARRALLTHSCTAALEMATILADIGPGDEVIMPSYTFVSTANAFVLRGGIPVFVDIRPDTLNLDETLIEGAITERTRAIVPVHYAGVGCEMAAITDIAGRHDLLVIEDAAQAIHAHYHGRPLGGIGQFGALSFHETKNVISGEGGALLLNDPKYVERAEIIREKGTNRSRYFRGEIDKYTWVDIGSSYLPGELMAAFLCAQLEEAQRITATRLEIWERYHVLFEPLERKGLLRRPIVPAHCTHNAHMYYLLLPSAATRLPLIRALRERGTHAIFHYVPLHDAPAGRVHARIASSMVVTEDLSARLLRLPMWVGLPFSAQELIVETIAEFLEGQPLRT
jgi:dTDP-4-amino-4,6-dideoxygalactose transaminase